MSQNRRVYYSTEEIDHIVFNHSDKLFSATINGRFHYNVTPASKDRLGKVISNSKVLSTFLDRNGVVVEIVQR